MSVSFLLNECNGSVIKMRAMELAKEHDFLYPTLVDKLKSILIRMLPSLEARTLKTIDVIALKRKDFI